MSAFDDYYAYIEGLHISQLRSQLIWLSSKTISSPIMTRLRHRHYADVVDTFIENPIDILFLRFTWKRYTLLDLAVIYADPVTKEIVTHLYGEKTFTGDNGITFTGLKKSRAWEWKDIEKSRLGSPLQIDESRSLQLWERPYNLYAVTEYDKDFRKEWKDGFLEYEGNNYGDTSEFYIIGSVQR